MRTYTEAEVTGELRNKATPPRGTTQKQVADSLGFSPQFINDVIGGRRDLTDALANSLGFRKVTYYVRKRGDDEQAA